MNKTIMVVDDNLDYLLTARKILEDKYNVLTANGASGMFEQMSHAYTTPDLIILDTEMPETSGFDVFETLKADNRYKDIPVMFMYSWNEDAAVAHPFETGASDFITKPLNRWLLLKRIESCLNVSDFVVSQKKINPTNHVYNNSLSIFAEIAENRDNVTKGHIDRVAAYVRLFMETLRTNPTYSEETRDFDLETVVAACRLHDIGKIALPDYILTKTSRLTFEEREIMKSHAQEGEIIIDKLLAVTGGNDPFLQHARIMAGTHHEHWDGGGYPRGLARTQIPIMGRVMAIADVYDALVTDRPYKASATHMSAAETILQGAGKQFDPGLIKIFSDTREMFRMIADK